MSCAACCCFSIVASQSPGVQKSATAGALATVVTGIALKALGYSALASVAIAFPVGLTIFAGGLACCAIAAIYHTLLHIDCRF